jgi:hypothetical protein
VISLTVWYLFISFLNVKNMSTITTSRTTPHLRPASSKKQAAHSASAKAKKNGDEIWDELLSTADSNTFLKQLSEQARQDYLNGETELGGFDGGGDT